MTVKQPDWDDEYLRTFGIIAVNTGVLEFKVRMFIAQLTLAAIPSSNLSDINFQLHLSLLITSEIGFHKTLTMLESLYKHIEQNQQLVNELLELTGKAAHAMDERNKILHSAWFFSNSKELIRVKTTAKNQKNKPTNLKFQVERTSVDNLKKVADSLSDANENIDKFMNRNGYSINRYLMPTD